MNYLGQIWAIRTDTYDVLPYFAYKEAIRLMVISTTSVILLYIFFFSFYLFLIVLKIKSKNKLENPAKAFRYKHHQCKIVYLFLFLLLKIILHDDWTNQCRIYQLPLLIHYYINSLFYFVKFITLESYHVFILTRHTTNYLKNILMSIIIRHLPCNVVRMYRHYFE